MSGDEPKDPPDLSNRRQAPRRQEDRRLVQRGRELEVARIISQALSQHVHSDGLIEQTLRTALDVVDAEAGSVLLADPSKKQLVFRHVVGVKADQLRGMAIPWDKGLAGVVFASGEAEIVSNAKEDHRHYPDIDNLTGFHTRDMIVLPLKQWGRAPIGVLEVLNKRQGRLDNEDVAILTIVSALSSAAIEQARLIEEAKLAELVHRMGDIAHDVNNLLMPVFFGTAQLQMQIDRLLDGLPDPDAPERQDGRQKCQRALNTLQDAARHIQDRTKEILDCVRGLHAPLQLASCRLSAVIESVVGTLGLVAERKGVDLRTDGLDSLPPILADERRLYNAFYNLVNNAIPEVPAGGTITVRGRVDPASDTICLSVIDTGRGMPPEVRDSLFSGHAISRKAGGTGIGTKIVKDAVGSHGGQITVESQVGVGTTFHIRLPLQPPGTATA
ncbi:MAG: GAF domain-containing protein [Nitrospirae bacterium]|nr:MAG: GAF domain-containing protein [Nitrospirota bacterium]